MPSRITHEEDDDPSSNLVDPTIAQLNDAKFDPVAFLNDVLPTLSLSAQPTSAKTSRSSQLQSASSDVQTFLTKVNAHNIRSSSELTSLTDEILRSGNRLAYEVEILRGDVNSMYDLLTETLRDDISQFVQHEAVQEDGRVAPSDLIGMAEDGSTTMKSDPEFMTQLRMLGTVKARLESVVAVFGEATKWPLPPSELSIANSLISVSAPELGIQTTEEDGKAHAVQRAFRGEIAELLDSEGGGHAGVAAATTRLEQLRDVARLWKGTAEERARNRFVDSLAKMIEDRKRTLGARSSTQRAVADSPNRPSTPGRLGRTEASPATGLLRNLARLKDDLYLE